MRLTLRNTAGTLLFVGAAQFLVAMIVAEALYPGYSVSGNWISDLGVGPTAALFNSSVSLFGILAVVGSYFLFRASKDHLLPALLALSGLGAMGVGIFPETTGMPHIAAATLAFIFGALAAIAAYRIERPPLSYFSVILGISSLTAMVLLHFQSYLGIGFGGMERMIVYPILLWTVGFGGYLMSKN
jgi:hypothetical membrane protein